MTSKSTKAREATHEFIKRVQENTKQWEADGRDAWSALKKLGAANLPKGDEVILAQNLGQEYANFKRLLKQKGESLGDFCENAGLGDRENSSKELHRLILRPGGDPKKARVRRSSAKYRNLIKAMARIFDESSATLAGRMLLGTSLHPTRAKELHDVAKVQTMLQEIVDSVDYRFDLYATFMRTAELKAKFAKLGRMCRWPQYDAEFRADLFEERQSLAELDTRYAYWENVPTNHDVKSDDPLGPWIYGPTPSGCWIDDEFFHVPHVHLGHGGGVIYEIRGDKREAAIEATQDSLKQFGVAPRDEWNTELEKPVGQESSMKYDESRYHAWLLIYPSPDNTRVMPMLMVPWEEGGPFLVPLDLNTLRVLEKTSFWVTPEGEVEGFLARIKRMLGYREGEKSLILEGLERTAPWLGRNPLIKLEEKRQREREQEQRDMQNFMKGLWERGGKSAATN